MDARMKSYWDKHWYSECIACCICGLCYLPAIRLTKEYRQAKYPWALLAFTLIITLWTFPAVYSVNTAMEKAEPSMSIEEMNTKYAEDPNSPFAKRFKSIMEEEFTVWGAASIAALRKGWAWTVVTCSFLHSGFMHWANNMLVFLLAGWQLNCTIGHWRLCLLYLVTAIGATLLEIAVSKPDCVLVGTSGVVFGVIGATLTMVFIHWHRFSAGKVSICVLIVWMVFKEIRTAANVEKTGVAHFAHLGGFICGVLFVIGVIDPYWNQDLMKDKKQKIGRILTNVALAALVVLLLATSIAVVCHCIV